MPFFIKRGKAINNTMDGAMSQTILFENSTAEKLSPVSIYIHVIAKMETKGMAANRAPIKLLLLAISEINTINNAVIISFAI